MLVLTFINKIFTVATACRPLFTDMLRRIFLEVDTDDLFSFFGSVPNLQSVSQSVLHILHTTILTV